MNRKSLLQVNSEDLGKSCWDELVAEPKSRPPTMHNLLNVCSEVKRCLHSSSQITNTNHELRPSNSAIVECVHHCCRVTKANDECPSVTGFPHSPLGAC